MPYHISSGSVRAESITVDTSRLDVTEFMDSFCTQNLMFDLTPVHYYSGFRLKRCQTSAEARHLYLSIPFPEKYEHYNQLAMYKLQPACRSANRCPIYVVNCFVNRSESFRFTTTVRRVLSILPSQRSKDLESG